MAIVLGHFTRCVLSVARFRQQKWRSIAVDIELRGRVAVIQNAKFKMQKRFARSSCCFVSASRSGAAGDIQFEILRLRDGLASSPAMCRVDSSQDIRDRAFAFACAVASVRFEWNHDRASAALIDQLLKSATAVGANLGRSQSRLVEARIDSLRRNLITRGARGGILVAYLHALELGSPADLTDLGCEPAESQNLGSIVVKTK